MKKIAVIIGTRPNFVKVTQFKRAAKQYSLQIDFIHTGQHYDGKMADVFFEQFKIKPDVFLNIAPASPISQMAEIMSKLEMELTRLKPDLLLVVGDVNSTLAAALTANKMQIPLAHVESGLRSDDRSMPEEINRLLTDEIADYFFVTEESGIENLRLEGKPESNTFLVGNTMIDTMVAFEKEIEASKVLQEYNLNKEFVLMTMHRPATVDSKVGLEKLILMIEEITSKYQLVFPIHPRTVKNAEEFGMDQKLNTIPNLILTEPLDYFSFQKLIKECKFILTDSGGIQEESTFRLVPCLTLRPNTERPVTITLGSNELVPFDIQLIKNKISEIETGKYKKGQVPPFWDGNASERIMKILLEKLSLK